jgi:hypothetical protein
MICPVHAFAAGTRVMPSDPDNPATLVPAMGSNLGVGYILDKGI